MARNTSRPGLFARRTFSERPELILVPAAFVFFVVVWEGMVRLFHVQVWLLPPPSAIAKALWTGFTTGRLYPHILTTLQETILGFLSGTAAGVLLGGIIAEFFLVEKTLFPYVVGFQSVPKVALAPLIIVWLGFGVWPKALIAALSALFPVVVNTLHGLRNTQQEQLDLMDSLCAKKWQVLKMVRIPNALPFLFAGLEVGIVSAVIGVIVGEFVGSQSGLGYLILQYNFTFDIPGVYAVLIVLSVLGIVLHQIIQYMHKRIVFWNVPMKG